MAAKKKTRKKPTRPTSKKTTGRKQKRTTNKRTTNKQTKKRAISRKTSAKKRPAQRKAAVKTKSGRAPQRRRKSQTLGGLAFSREESRARSGGQSGDLQGLSGVAGPDSESVDELVEEGNAFEADVVSGVEEAGNAEGKELRTHEVPEDDVPDEYLEKD
jgi:hypothetical protein